MLPGIIIIGWNSIACQCAETHLRHPSVDIIHRAKINCGMSSGGKFDFSGHAHFLTFSCYKRRRLLDDDSAKGVVVNVLSSQLTQRGGKCQGFVVMPDHVHALVWFSEPNKLSEFLKQWKRLTSYSIKKNVIKSQPGYAGTIPANDPVWQRRYYSFDVVTEAMMREKLGYMHGNPVKAGLVSRPEQWRFGSARHYELGQPVGVEIGMPG